MLTYVLIGLGIALCIKLRIDRPIRERFFKPAKPLAKVVYMWEYPKKDS